MFKRKHLYFDQAGDGTGQGGEGAGGQGGEGQQGAPGAWYDSFKGEDVKGWLKSYNDAYPDPEAVATKAFNLEKFLGADKAGRGVIVPKADSKPEEWSEFYRKVGGVPDSADKYPLSPEFKTDPMFKSFAEHAHKAGMPPVFFETAAKWYQEEMTKLAGQTTTSFEAAADKDIQDLKVEWAGPEYDKNIEMGRRAARAFIPHDNPEQLAEAISKIEGALGTKATLKLWANIGASVGEHSFVDGGNSGGFGMSPEAARTRIAELKRDSGFLAKISGGDADSRAEWDRLHKLGYSE
jgi:hypothetical protein